MAEILKGAPAVREINAQIEENVSLALAAGITPTLAIVRVGENPDDVYYENSAIKKCGKMDIAVTTAALPADTDTDSLADIVRGLAKDETVHGILLLRPLPKHIDEDYIVSLIPEGKDVDGASQKSLGGIFAGDKNAFCPCTAEGCIRILEHYGIALEGKRTAVIGRSTVIGKPVSMLLLNRNATVTICHTKTKNLSEITKSADIIVTCAGKAKSLTADMVSGGQTVIDVGMNEGDDGVMCGDADYNAVSDIVGAITPVPGGVGTMTTAILVLHTAKAAVKCIK